MTKRGKIEVILEYLKRNPLSSMREISDNASDTRINYDTVKKTIAALVIQNKVGELADCFYVLPVIDKEISFMFEITDLDKILKLRFKKLEPIKEYLATPSFQQILRQYIVLFHFWIKIRQTELKLLQKTDTINSMQIDTIRDHLKKYINSFKPGKNSTAELFQKLLHKHINDKYFYSTKHYSELKSRGKTMEKKLEIVNTWLKSYNMREVADQHRYKSNKAARNLIESLFYENGNPKLDQMWISLRDGRISNEELSDVFLNWWRQTILKKYKTKEERRLARKRSKELFEIDLLKPEDIKSFDIS